MMKKRWNRKGFSLAEVLIVVGIIVVLMGVGAVALFSHMRTMHQLEMDGQAKELFVAAQNHLSLAESQGYLGKTKFGTGDYIEPGNDIYYFVVGGGDNPDDTESVLNQMLPVASVDEAARTTGSYIIRYQKTSGTILDVFYASSDSRYGYTFINTEESYKKVMDTRADKDARRNYEGGAVLGYYGGVAAADLDKGDPLSPPTIEVVNAETLYVNIHDPNQGSTGPNNGKNVLQLVITGQSSKAQCVFTLYNSENTSIVNETTVGEDRASLLSPANYRVMLDSVTGDRKLHFYKLNDFKTESASPYFSINGAFKPGENLEIQAISLNNEKITNIAESSISVTNSLFATLEGTKEPVSGNIGNGVVGIENFRHLVNLDSATVSNLNSDISLVKAQQTKDLDWTAFLTTTGASGITAVTSAGDTTGSKFLPVTVGFKMEYDGGSHKVSNIDVDTSGNGGLFKALAQESTIHDLELVDFKVKASGDAGALAGSLMYVNVTGVLVHNSATGTGDDSAYFIKSTSGNAGGLAGSITGSLIGSTYYGVVDSSAAAVYVNGSTAAGGLVGKVSGTVTVTSSFSGGHTLEAKYLNDLSAAEDADGRFNTVSNGAAGGLIGDASGAALTVSYSYSTASAYGGTAAGGLIGDGKVGSGSAVSYSYATGLVETAGSGKKGAFVGDKGDALQYINIDDPEDSSKKLATCYYLENISDEAGQAVADFLVAASSGDTTYTNFLLPVDAREVAVIYDERLSARYDFPTVQKLHSLYGDTYAPTGLAASLTSVHYGDWQLPSLTKLDFKFLDGYNGDTVPVAEKTDDLIAQIKLESNTKYITLALYGETTHNARVYIIDVSDTADPTIISEAAVSCTVGADGKVIPGSPSWTRTSGFSPMRLTSKTTTEGETSTTVVTAVLDTVSIKGGHFVQLFADDDGDSSTEDAKLLPGENVSLYVGGGQGSLAEALSFGREEENSKEAIGDFNPYGKVLNSLFHFAYEKNAGEASYAYLSNLTTSMSSAALTSFRHLLNLDSSTSYVNVAGTATQKVTSATLRCDLDWNEDYHANKYPAIYHYTGNHTTAENAFSGIYNNYLTSLTGHYEDGVGSTVDYHTISNLRITATTGNYSYIDGTSLGNNNAGLFRYVTNNLTIDNLHLQEPRVTSDSGHAGAFVASNNGTVTLNTVLAEGTMACGVTGGTTSGGLVGNSKGKLNINNSAASLLVTASGPAGGLVGKQESNVLTIADSYVGGHTYAGFYYVDDDDDADTDGVDPSGKRWNIISKTGAAGGILGELSTEASAGITQTFSAASVYSTGAGGGLIGIASGEITALNLVYVVAPVYNVKEMVSTGTGIEPTPGNAGAIIGVSSETITGSDTMGSGIFFLPSVYVNPLPTTLVADDGSVVSSIKTIGDGTLENTKLAYYFVKAGVDNAILPYVDEDRMEQQTDAFDGTLGEYPFAIWTMFPFDGTNERHYYGDWQPAENGPTIELDVHFLTVIPEDAAAGTARVVKHLTTRDQEIAVQVPYEVVSILLPWPDDVFNYDFGDWQIYYDDHIDDVFAGTEISEDDTSKVTVSYSASSNGTNVYLSAAEYKQASQDKYFSTGADGKKHLHLTLVSTYTPKENKLYKLEFYDQNFTTNAEGKDVPDGWSDTPLTYQVLEPKPDEGKTKLSQLVEGKQPPTRSKAEYRFLGWYTAQTGGSVIYENVYNAADNSFKLELNETNAAAIDVVSNDKDVKLYARYEEIAYRTLTVKFMDGDGNQIPSVEPYEIRFEGDRGFKETVVPLPYEDGVLWPDTGVTPTVTPATSGITWNLTGTSPTVTIAIAAVDEVTDANREIECKVTYKVNAEYTGYVVLYELMDTNSTFAYAAGSSYVYGNTSFSSISGNTYLYGSTIKGFSPGIEVAEDARYAEYLLTLQPEGFAISNEKFYKEIPAKYEGKYPEKVTTAAGELDVTCLIVIQCRRQSNWLTFDSDGGTNIAPVKLTYGTKLNDILKGGTANYLEAYKPSYASYTFIKWVYMDAGAETDVTDAVTMPAHDLELKAKREGAPVPFTVVFMEQDPNNAGDYTVSKMYETYRKSGADRDLMANAGSDVNVTLDRTNKTAKLTWTDGTAAETVTYTMKTENAEYQYFNLNSALTGTKFTVSDDGSTVVKIYLDRNYYSVWFRIGRATKGNIRKTVGKFDDEVGTHEVFQYTKLDGSTFWAYEDEDAPTAKPYGEESDRYFELDKTTEYVDVYKPQWVYTPEPEDDADEPLYGVSGGYYVELHKEGGYTEVSTRSTTETNYYGLVGGKYEKINYRDRTYSYGYVKNNSSYHAYSSGYTYDTTNSTGNDTQYGVVDNTLYRLTRRGGNGNRYWVYTLNGREVRYNGTRYTRYNSYYGDYFFDEGMWPLSYQYVFTWVNGTTEYSWVISSNSTLDNRDTILGGPHYLSNLVWQDDDHVTYDNVTRFRYSRTGYTSDTVYEADDDEMVEVGGVYWFNDGRALVEAVKQDTQKPVDIFKRKGTSEVYDHKTKHVYWFVIVEDPKDLNVQEFIPKDSNNQYHVSIYGSNGYSWSNEYNTDRRRVNVGWNENPFTWIPSKNLRLTGPEVGETAGEVYFYYSIWARYGADISDQWPDVRWLNDEGRNAGVMSLRSLSSSDVADYKFTSWLFPQTSRYYYLHSSTMTSIKGPYATMSEELILQRSNSTSTTFFDSPDDGAGNNPSVTLYGRYRPTPYWWRYVLHFGVGGLNPDPDDLDTRNDSHWSTKEIYVYSDGPSKNQNPLEYFGYNTPAKGDTVHWTPQKDGDGIRTDWKNIDYYYIPEIRSIQFNAKPNPEGQFDEIAVDNYFYGTNLSIADIHGSAVSVPSGYEFKGWYENPLGEGTAFNFDSEIRGNLILYAIVTPVDKTVTFTLPVYEEQQPEWAEGGYADRVFTAVPHKSTLTARIGEDGRSFTPKLEGYKFLGWVETADNTPFAPSQQVLKDYTLKPSWEKLPDPVYETVTVKYLYEDDEGTTHVLHDPEEVTVTKDESFKFTARSIGGYKPVSSYYYEFIDDEWLGEHEDGSSYSFTIEYVPSESSWNYQVEYALYLRPVSGGSPVAIPMQSETQTSDSNFSSVSFFSLPENLRGFKFDSVELYEGDTKMDSTTDPIIFVKKASNVKLVVHVVPDDSYFLQGDIVRTYNTHGQSVDAEFSESLPNLPTGVSFVRTVEYTYYSGSRPIYGNPVNTGAYGVEVEITVSYEGVDYMYWKSASVASGRPDIVLYINRCDVIVTSNSVTNVFYDSAENREARDNGLLPDGAVLATLAKDDGVTISGVAEDIQAKLIRDMLVSPSADSFRRASSTGPLSYTSNVFTCELGDTAENANYNFYKVYGKIYLWKNLAAYNEWLASGG